MFQAPGCSTRHVWSSPVVVRALVAGSGVARWNFTRWRGAEKQQQPRALQARIRHQTVKKSVMLSGLCLQRRFHEIPMSCGVPNMVTLVRSGSGLRPTLLSVRASQRLQLQALVCALVKPEWMDVVSLKKSRHVQNQRVSLWRGLSLQDSIGLPLFVQRT